MTAVAEKPVEPATSKRRRTGRRPTSPAAHGEPMLWLTGGALAVALVMIAGLVALVIVNGTTTFWPSRVMQVRTLEGQTYLGEVTDVNRYRPGDEVYAALPKRAAAAVRQAVDASGGLATRRLLRTEIFDESCT